MTLSTLLPFVTGAILIILTLDVFRRYLVHRGAHTYTLIWAIGLTMFTLATLSEGVLGLTWSEGAFYTWYLFGALLSAAWIGQGTVHLLFHAPWVRLVTIVLAILSLAVMFILLATPLTADAFKTGVPISLQYGDILPKDAFVRRTTIPFNIYGTITLAGGALWSGYLFWRKRVLPNRVIGNVLIAAGALSIATASSLARLGSGEFLALGQLLFAVLIYVGFVQASKPAAVEGAAATPAA
ncbi:MAG TPA: hypothetical protein VIX58_04240 [Anaerolineae bacterium]